MLSKKVVRNLENSSIIRAMFEEGEKLRKQYGADQVYDFSIGNPDPEPPEAAKNALKKLILDDKPGLHSYMQNAGYPDVRKKIAEYLNKENGSQLTYENIIMTVGAGGGLNVILKAILNPDEEVIVLSPYFVEYGFYIDNHGGKIVIVPTETDTFQPDLAAIEKAINKNTKAIIINSPHNPTGVVYNEKILTELAALLSRKENELGITIFVISDEPYRDIVYDGVKVPSILSIFKNSIIGYSYSKSLSLPGERIGYVAASDRIENVSLLNNALVFANRSLGFVNAPSLFQRVIGETIGETVDIKIYQDRRDLFYGHLTKLGFECLKPQGAFYLFPKSPLRDVMEFKNAALKHRIILVPGSGFGCPTHFRLSYCVSMKTIENSLPSFEALAKEVGIYK